MMMLALGAGSEGCCCSPPLLPDAAPQPASRSCIFLPQVLALLRFSHGACGRIIAQRKALKQTLAAMLRDFSLGLCLQPERTARCTCRL
eukprot:3744898-Rhodomonas_salina.2